VANTWRSCRRDWRAAKCPINSRVMSVPSKTREMCCCKTNGVVCPVHPVHNTRCPLGELQVCEVRFEIRNFCNQAQRRGDQLQFA
jgi:hypothetical protein